MRHAALGRAPFAAACDQIYTYFRKNHHVYTCTIYIHLRCQPPSYLLPPLPPWAHLLLSELFHLPEKAAKALESPKTPQRGALMEGQRHHGKHRRAAKAQGRQGACPVEPVPETSEHNTFFNIGPSQLDLSARHTSRDNGR